MTLARYFALGHNFTGLAFGGETFSMKFLKKNQRMDLSIIELCYSIFEKY